MRNNPGEMRSGGQLEVTWEIILHAEEKCTARGEVTGDDDDNDAVDYMTV